jgi:hypothetical protein
VARRDFVAIRQIPEGVDADMTRLLNSIKENLELLMRMRGDPNNAAIVKGDVSTDYPAAVITSLTNTSGMTLANTQAALNTMISQVVTDLTNLQITLNNLMINLKT